jgi:dTDP-4-dehydrorhamnose 3,5-epimerase
MKFIQQQIKDVFEIKLNPIEDFRGFFMRTFDEKLFEENNLKCNWVQENHSLSIQKGTLRGMHFQFPPFSETKLIRAIKGEVLDVFVDLRLDSFSFGKWGSILLSDKMKNMVLIPRGFAHGYCTLSENTEVIYKVDNIYSPKYESGIKWDDPEIGIDWQIEKPIVSVKDSNQPSFEEFKKTFKALK